MYTSVILTQYQLFHLLKMMSNLYHKYLNNLYSLYMLSNNYLYMMYNLYMMSNMYLHKI